MPSIDPRNVSFGAVAAETDVGLGLSDYFLDTESFRRLRDGTKSVALGNRGAGKSAIFKMVAEHATKSGSIVVELAPEDYSYEILSSELASEASGSWAKQGAYAAAWKYLIYVEAIRRVVSFHKGFKSGAGARLHGFVRDNFKDSQRSPIGTLVSFLKRLEGVKVGKYEAGFKTRELQRLYKLEDINQHVMDLEEVAGRSPVVVLVDELDRGWDASEDAKNFVSGLFQAAMRLNVTHKNLRVMLSLRRELYDSIPALYDDAQKDRDRIEYISWNEAQLQELIARRIGHSVDELRDREVDTKWNAVFSETLAFRSTKSFNYMVDRSLYRPREIIQFCKDVVDEVITRGDELPANYPVVSAAEARYSESRLQDIASEYRHLFPGLDSVFDTFRGHLESFDRDVLELHCLSVALGERGISEEAKTWCRDIEPDHLIDVLWDVGFLRALAVGGVKATRRSGSSYVGPHQIATLNLANVSRFQIHPMFRVCLGTKEPKGKQSHKDT